MREKILFGVLAILIILSILGFALSPTGFVTFQTQIDQDYLENLRLKAEVECLQNSQCSEDFECVANECIDSREIDVCQNMGLSLSARRLEIGDPINSVVGVIVESDLPYLLPHGEIVKIENDEAVIYLYEQMIWIGDNKVEEKDGDYVILDEESIYEYSLVFSKGVDFSSKEIQGQVLRILGKEYVIGDNSDNSIIELVSDAGVIRLDNENSEIIRNGKGEIVRVNIEFGNEQIKESENQVDSVFDSIKFDFNFVNEGMVYVHVGGNC